MRSSIKGILLILILLTLTFACKDSSSGAYYRKLRGVPTGDVVIRADSLSVYVNETAFARENLSTLSVAEVAALPSNARQILLKRLLLRRLSIEDGLKRDIYDSADAMEYILPRFEKILEDYYFYKMSEEASWSRRLREIEHDEKAIHAFLKDKDSVHISSQEFKQVTRSTVDRVIQARREKERSRLQGELLRCHPIEVLP